MISSRGDGVPSSEESKIAAALEVARYGTTDGDHHKMWVIDQMIRALLDDKYEDWVTEFCGGEDGPDTYEWDEGVPP